MTGFDRRSVLKAAGTSILGAAAASADVAAAGRAEGATVYAGSSALVALDADTGEERWRYGRRRWDLDSSPTAVDGTVYVGASETGSTEWRNGIGTALWAVDAATGEREWAHTGVGDGIATSPTVVDGTVYVCRDDGAGFGSVYAVDAGTGELEWEFGDEQAPALSAPNVVDGTVYVTTTAGYLYALDADTGDREWTFFLPGDAIDSSPTVYGGVAYVFAGDGALYALDAATGERKWAYEGRGGLSPSRPTAVDGTIYVAGSGGRLLAVDAATGDREWKIDDAASGVYPPTVREGTVYALATDGRLLAVDADTGAREWASPVSGAVEYTALTAHEQTVYVGDSEGTTSAIDAATGDVLWSYHHERRGTVASPTVVSEPANGHSVGSRVRLGSLGHHHAWNERASAASVEAVTEPRDARGAPGFGVLAGLGGLSVAGKLACKYGRRDPTE